MFKHETSAEFSSPLTPSTTVLLFSALPPNTSLRHLHLEGMMKNWSKAGDVWSRITCHGFKNVGAPLIWKQMGYWWGVTRLFGYTLLEWKKYLSRAIVITPAQGQMCTQRGAFWNKRTLKSLYLTIKQLMGKLITELMGKWAVKRPGL